MEDEEEKSLVQASAEEAASTVTHRPRSQPQRQNPTSSGSSLDIASTLDSITARDKSNTQTVLFGLAVLIGLTLLVELAMGLLNGSIKLINDAMNSLIFLSVLANSLRSVHAVENRDARADAEEYSFGFGRTLVAATFVNSIYLIFQCVFSTVHILHEVVESLGQESEELQNHHNDETFTSVGTKIAVVRCTALALVLLLKMSVRRFRDRVLDFYLRETHSDDIGYRNAKELLFFSVKLMLFSELLVNLSTLWSSLVLAPLGSVQHALSFATTAAIFLLAMPAFAHSTYILLQKNYPASAELESDMKKVSFVEGVLAVAKTHLWTVDGKERVGTVRAHITPEADYYRVQAEIFALLGKHFSKATNLTIHLERAGH